MPVQLPTDTRHVQPTAKLHELFGHRLREGVPYRVMVPGIVAFVVWLPIMWAAGVWSLGPTPGMFCSIVPPVAGVWAATRIDESGRMAMVAGWDRLLARRKKRRLPVRNPLVPAAAAGREPLVVLTGEDAWRATELRPEGDDTPIRKVWSTTPRRGTRRQAGSDHGRGR
jgi:hypothetical protein